MKRCQTTFNKTHKLVYILLLFVFFWCPENSFSQSTGSGMVKGKITDQSGAPLPYTQVQLEGTSHKTMTDIDGNFLLKNIKAGTYTVKTTLMGFLPSVKEVKVQNNKTTTVKDVSMKENVKQLNEVVVEAPKTEAEEIRESGFSVDVIEMEENEKQSLQTNELLDQEAGIRIRQQGGLGSRIRYNLNGLSGNAVRIFLDGIPIENYGASFSLNSIPTSMIERIEVYKGVVPAQFGSDALGGAINVITKKNAPNTLNASLSYGSFNTWQASLNGNYRDSTSGFTVKGSAFYNYSDNNYKVWGEQIYLTNPDNGKIQYTKAERFHDTYESGGVKLDAGFTNVKWADQFFVGVLASGMKKDHQHGATMETVYGNRWIKQNSLLFSTNYLKKDILTKGLDLNLFASYSDLKRNIIDTVPYMYDWDGEVVIDRDGDPITTANGAEAGNPTLNEAREQNIVFRGNINYRINEHHAFNVNQLSDNFTRKPNDPLWAEAQRANTDTRYMSKNTTGITYMNSAFKDKLKTTVFYKFYYQKVRLKDPERIGRTDQFTSVEYDKVTTFNGYGLATGYHIIPELEITASVEKAIRMPNSTEVFGNQADAIDPAYQIQPEQSYNGNAGFRLGAIRWRKHKFYLNFNAFVRSTRGMIRQVVADERSETYSFENTERILSKGFDTEFRYLFDNKLDLTTGASIFNARFNLQYDENGAEYIYYGDRLRNEPYFTLNNNLRYTISNFIQNDSRFSTYYNISYVHEFYRDWESLGGRGKNIIPSQLVHSLGFYYTFPKRHLTLGFDAKNITNEQVFDNWALQKPGRAFYVKITYTIL